MEWLAIVAVVAGVAWFTLLVRSLRAGRWPSRDEQDRRDRAQ